MKDLFGNEMIEGDGLTTKRYGRPATNPKARASGLPGPDGETCGTCVHAYRRGNARRKYYKCGIAHAAPTAGPGTDIRVKDRACSRHERKPENEVPAFLRRVKK